MAPQIKGSFTVASVQRSAVAQLNNLGVQCISQGDYYTARGAFRRALSDLTNNATNLLRHASPQDDSVRGGMPNKESLEVSAPFAMYGVPATAARCEAYKTLDSQDSCPGSLTSLVYSQGLCIPPEPISLSDEHEHIFCSAILVFNLALISHLQAIGGAADRTDGFGMSRQNTALFFPSQISSKPSKEIVRAQSLYEQCVRLLFGTSVSQSQTPCHPTIDMLSMAALNNLAHVCYERLDFHKSKGISNSLLQLVSTIDSSGYQCQEASSVIQEAQHNFCLNTYVLRKPPETAQAA